ncbi:MAG: hypothetical protein IPO95_15130 [Rhodanobacteraceae bacterium]|nr:hypothetical protein [Rhodanobacteraceae bacterium]
MTPDVAVQDPALALIVDRIDAQRWFEPKEGSASALLADALQTARDDERLRLADRFIVAVRGTVMRALDEARDGDAVDLIRHLREFILGQRLQDRAASTAFEAALSESTGGAPDRCGICRRSAAGRVAGCVVRVRCVVAGALEGAGRAAPGRSAAA